MIALGLYGFPFRRYYTVMTDLYVYKVNFVSV